MQTYSPQTDVIEMNVNIAYTTIAPSPAIFKKVGARDQEAVAEDKAGHWVGRSAISAKAFWG